MPVQDVTAIQAKVAEVIAVEEQADVTVLERVAEHQKQTVEEAVKTVTGVKKVLIQAYRARRLLITNLKEVQNTDGEVIAAAVEVLLNHGAKDQEAVVTVELS